MRARALSLALLVAIMALPVPASQFLVGSSSAPSPRVRAIASHDLATLLQDPFLLDEMRFARPASFLEVDTGVPYDQL